MKIVSIKVLNAFVDGTKGGNAAGVMIDTENLSQEVKQFIATKVGLSETVFISSSKIADFKLEFFTPVKQIEDCGHATVAAFSYLHQSGVLSDNKSSKEIIGGVRDIFISGEAIFMEQIAPTYKSLRNKIHNIDSKAILSSLGVTSSALMKNTDPVIANNGFNCLLIPLKDKETLKNLQPNFEKIADISRKLNLIEYYVFSTETFKSGRDGTARMFAPHIGIPEEAATGMAAGPLACYLYNFLNVKKTKFSIEQGFLMNPPSPSELIIQLTIENQDISKLIVGGRAMMSDIISVTIPQHIHSFH